MSTCHKRGLRCREDDNAPSVGEVLMGVLDVFCEFGVSFIVSVDGIECICVDDCRSSQISKLAGAGRCGAWNVGGC